ncbi:MAG TPA: aspartate aminotransferase family protein [Rhizomicrobium sp.]
MPIVTPNAEAASRSPVSADLFARARKVMPDGNTRLTIFFPPFPPYAAHASGYTVTDADGVQRIDFINNYSSLIHGHCPAPIRKAVGEQITQLFAVGLPTRQEVELAELLCARVASIDHIRFANSGTEAVMLAIKAARAYTGKTKVAKIEGAFHGSYDPTEVSLASTPGDWGPADHPASVALCRGTPASTLDDVVVLPHNDIETARRLIRENDAALAAVIVDPLPSRLSFAAASRDFLAMLREETSRQKSLLVFDEVYSFRLGYGGAQEALGIRPDLTALGKIIGGGLPVGAIGGSKEAMSVFASEDGMPRVVHGGTYNANPMTMAAGLAAMRMLTPDALNRLDGLGERLRTGMREVVKRLGVPATVRGQGSLASLRFSDKPADDYRAMMTDGADLKLAARVHLGLLDEGILCTSTLLFILSTPMNETVIDMLLERLESVLRKQTKAGL